MYFYNVLFLFTTIVVNAALGQSVSEWGARSAAMGNSNVTSSDVYSGLNNIAGLSLQNNLAFYFGFKNNFGVAAFSGAYAGLNLPIKSKTASISFSRFGDNLYNEQTLSLGVAHQLNYISLGVKVDLLQQHIDETLTRRCVAIALGGMVEITKYLTFGGYVWNINQAKKQHSEHYLPTLLKAGFAYNKDNKFIISNEVYKSTEHKPDLRFGLEYFLTEWFAFRTGLNTYPLKLCMGAGFRKKVFGLDYAYNNHHLLDNIHQISLVYSIK
ncbi:MAG TPA: hypothetical protein VIK89_12345 [Cytophagaceae bacterium]